MRLDHAGRADRTAPQPPRQGPGVRIVAVAVAFRKELAGHRQRPLQHGLVGAALRRQAQRLRAVAQRGAVFVVGLVMDGQLQLTLPPGRGSRG